MWVNSMVIFGSLRKSIKLTILFRWLIHREEIQRIKASNPDISHREAFSTAAKNVSDLISISTQFINTSTMV